MKGHGKNTDGVPTAVSLAGPVAARLGTVGSAYPGLPGPHPSHLPSRPWPSTPARALGLSLRPLKTALQSHLGFSPAQIAVTQTEDKAHPPGLLEMVAEEQPVAPGTSAGPSS